MTDCERALAQHAKDLDRVYAMFTPKPLPTVDAEPDYPDPETELPYPDGDLIIGSDGKPWSRRAVEDWRREERDQFRRDDAWEDYDHEHDEADHERYS